MLDTTDIVGSIKNALDDGIRQGISELDKRKKKLKRLHKNRHRTKDDLILRVFVKHIGVLKMEIKGIKTELRRLDIALYLIKDAYYDFDAPEPVPQQGGIYFTVSGAI
ncbi:MAG TPA: hypothetical protein ENG75_03415 [Nitrospirae bacterium]|nr:hypothetical protein [Nitrospirota bacterium]